jgi:hypothetical protein
MLAEGAVLAMQNISHLYHITHDGICLSAAFLPKVADKLVCEPPSTGMHEKRLLLTMQNILLLILGFGGEEMLIFVLLWGDGAAWKLSAWSTYRKNMS